MSVRQNFGFDINLVFLVAVDGVEGGVRRADCRHRAQRLGVFGGWLCLDPLVEHGKLAVNVVYKRRAVIQHGGLHILIPLHGQSECFGKKAYRNISAALLLVRCGINSGGLDNLAGAVIGYGKLLAAERERQRFAVLLSGDCSGVICDLGAEHLGNGAEGNHHVPVYLFRLCVRKVDIRAVELHGKLTAEFVFIALCHGTRCITIAFL